MVANNRTFNAIAGIASAAALAMNLAAQAESQTNDWLENGKETTTHFQGTSVTSNASITGQASWNELQDLQRIYDVYTPAQVYSFVNSQITALLIEAETQIKSLFRYSRLSLTVKTDPDNGTKVLLVSIFANADLDSAEMSLDKFYRNWWFLQTWVPSEKQICIDVVPV